MFSLKGTVSRGAFWTFNKQSPYLQTFMEPRNRFRQTGIRLLGSLKDLQIRALERYLFTTRTVHFFNYLNSISWPSPFNPSKKEQSRAPNGTNFSAQVTLKVYIVIVLVIYSKDFLSIPCHFFFLVTSYSFPLSVSLSINTQYVPPMDEGTLKTPIP